MAPPFNDNYGHQSRSKVLIASLIYLQACMLGAIIAVCMLWRDHNLQKSNVICAVAYPGLLCWVFPKGFHCKIRFYASINIHFTAGILRDLLGVPGQRENVVPHVTSGQNGQQCTPHINC